MCVKNCPDISLKDQDIAMCLLNKITTYDFIVHTYGMCKKSVKKKVSIKTCEKNLTRLKKQYFLYMSGVF
jgi:hypothetical protein